MEFDTEAARGRIPVVAGASYNIWNPDAGTPFAYGTPRCCVRISRANWHGAVRTLGRRTTD